MAERRMFAKTIIDSDAFLAMPLASQALYFHLAMRADDDGFVNNPLSIARLVGAKNKDYESLCSKNFIIPFDSGVAVIKHWKINNYLRSDRYKPTTYEEEKAQLTTKENGAYSLIGIPSGRQMVDQRYTESGVVYQTDTNGTPMVYPDKDSIGKLNESKKESNKNNTYLEANAGARESYDEIIEDFALGGVPEHMRYAYKDTIIEFIRHCQVNGKVVTNDKLKNLIIRLDMAYDREDTVSKIRSLKAAINGGYFDIKEGRK